MSRKRAKILAGAMGAAIVGTTAAPALATSVTTTQASQQSTMQSAKQMLTSAQSELDDARTTAATVREQASSGAIDNDVLSELQPDDDAAYHTGAPEIELIAGLLGHATPEATLRQASIRELSTMTPPEPTVAVPDEPVVITTPAQAVKAAEARVAEAQQDKSTAEALIKQLNGQVESDGPGAAKLSKLCTDAGVVVEICQPVRWNEAHLQFDTVMIGRTVNIMFPDVKKVGGWRPYDPYPDHPSGRAADIMMPNGGTGSDVKLGNEIATYFQKHAKEYGIYYMLWRQRMWKAGDPVGAWTSVSDRGDPTSNHMDHVHISVTTGHDGTAWGELVKDAKKAAKA